MLFQSGDAPVNFTRGTRFVQLVPFFVGDMELSIVQELSSTARAEGGFGSTDVKEEPITISGMYLK